MLLFVGVLRLLLCVGVIVVFAVVDDAFVAVAVIVVAVAVESRDCLLLFFTVP